MKNFHSCYMHREVFYICPFFLCLLVFYIFYQKCLWIWTAGFPVKLSIFRHGAQGVLDFSFHVLPTKGQPLNYDPSSLLRSPNCKGTIEQSFWSQFTLLLAASNLRSNPHLSFRSCIWYDDNFCSYRFFKIYILQFFKVF